MTPNNSGLLKKYGLFRKIFRGKGRRGRNRGKVADYDDKGSREENVLEGYDDVPEENIEPYLEINPEEDTIEGSDAVYPELGRRRITGKGDGIQIRKPVITLDDSEENESIEEENNEGEIPDRRHPAVKGYIGKDAGGKVPVGGNLGWRKVKGVYVRKTAQKSTVRRKGNGAEKDSTPDAKRIDKPDSTEENVFSLNEDVGSVSDENVADNDLVQTPEGNPDSYGINTLKEYSPKEDQPDESHADRNVIPGKDTESHVPVKGILGGKKVKGVRFGKLVPTGPIRRKGHGLPEANEPVDETIDRPDITGDRNTSPVPDDDSTPGNERLDVNGIAPNDDIGRAPNENVDDKEPGLESVHKPDGIEQTEPTEELAEGVEPDGSRPRKDTESKISIKGILGGKKVKGVRFGKIVPTGPIRRKGQGLPEANEPVDETIDRPDITGDRNTSPVPDDDSTPGNERLDVNGIAPNDDIGRAPNENVDDKEPGLESVHKPDGIEQTEPTEELAEGAEPDGSRPRKDTESKMPVKGILGGKKVKGVRFGKIVPTGPIRRKGQGLPEANEPVDETIDRPDITGDRNTSPVPDDDSTPENERLDVYGVAPNDEIGRVSKENVDDKEPGLESVHKPDFIEQTEPTEELSEVDQPDGSRPDRNGIPRKDTESKVPVKGILGGKKVRGVRFGKIVPTGPIRRKGHGLPEANEPVDETIDRPDITGDRNTSPVPDDDSTPGNERLDVNGIAPNDDIGRAPNENVDDKEPGLESVHKPDGIEQTEPTEELAEGVEPDGSRPRKDTESKMPVKGILGGKKVKGVRFGKIVPTGPIRRKGQGLPEANEPVDETIDRPDITGDRNTSPVPDDDSTPGNERLDVYGVAPNDEIGRVPKENIDYKEPGLESVHNPDFIEQTEPTEELSEVDQPDGSRPDRNGIPRKDTESKVPVKGILGGKKVKGVRFGKIVPTGPIRRKGQGPPEPIEPVEETIDRPDITGDRNTSPDDDSTPGNERLDVNGVAPNDDIGRAPKENVDDKEPGLESVHKPDGVVQTEPTEELPEGGQSDGSRPDRNGMQGKESESQVPVKGTLVGKKDTGVRIGKIIRNGTTWKKGKGAPEENEPVDETTDRPDISGDRNISPVRDDESSPGNERLNVYGVAPNDDIGRVAKENVDDKEPGLESVRKPDFIEQTEPTEELSEGDQPSGSRPDRNGIPRKDTEGKVPVKGILGGKKVKGVRFGKIVPTGPIRRKGQGLPEPNEPVDETIDRPDITGDRNTSPVPDDDSTQGNERLDVNGIAPNDDIGRAPKENVDDKEPGLQSVHKPDGIKQTEPTEELAEGVEPDGSRPRKDTESKMPVKGILGGKKVNGVRFGKIVPTGPIRRKGQGLPEANEPVDETIDRPDITGDRNTSPVPDDDSTPGNERLDVYGVAPNDKIGRVPKENVDDKEPGLESVHKPDFIEQTEPTEEFSEVDQPDGSRPDRNGIPRKDTESKVPVKGILGGKKVKGVRFGKIVPTGPIRRKGQGPPEPNEPVDETIDRPDITGDSNTSPVPDDDSTPGNERLDVNGVAPNDDIGRAPKENVDDKEPGLESVHKPDGIEQTEPTEELPEGVQSDGSRPDRNGMQGKESESQVPVKGTLVGKKVTGVRIGKIIRNGTTWKKGKGAPEENKPVDETTDRPDISGNRNISPVPDDESSPGNERLDVYGVAPNDDIGRVPKENVDDKEPGLESVRKPDFIEQTEPTEELSEGDQPSGSRPDRNGIPQKDTESKVPVKGILGGKKVKGVRFGKIVPTGPIRRKGQGLPEPNEPVDETIDRPDITGDRNTSPVPDDDSTPGNERLDVNGIAPNDDIGGAPKENVDDKEPGLESVHKPDGIEQTEPTEELAEGVEPDGSRPRKDTESKMPVKGILGGKKVNGVRFGKIVPTGPIRRKGQGLPEANEPVDETIDRPDITGDRNTSPVPDDDSTPGNERLDVYGVAPNDEIGRVAKENVDDKEPGLESVHKSDFIEQTEPTEELSEVDQPDGSRPDRNVIPRKDTESKVPVKGILGGKKVKGVRFGKIVPTGPIRRKGQGPPEPNEPVDETIDRPDITGDRNTSPVPDDDSTPGNERLDVYGVAPNDDIGRVPKENVDDKEPGLESVRKPDFIEQTEPTEELSEGDQPSGSRPDRNEIPRKDTESKVPIKGTLGAKKIKGAKVGKIVPRVNVRRKDQGAPEKNEPVEEPSDRPDITGNSISSVPDDERRQEIERPESTEKSPKGDQPGGSSLDRNKFFGKGKRNKVPIKGNLGGKKVKGGKVGKRIQKGTIRQKDKDAPGENEPVDETADRLDIMGDYDVSGMEVKGKPRQQVYFEPYESDGNESTEESPGGDGLINGGPRRKGLTGKGARRKGSVKGNFGVKMISGVIKKKVLQRDSLKGKAIGQAVISEDGSNDGQPDIIVNDVEPGKVEGSYSETEDFEQPSNKNVLNEGTTDVKRSRRGKRIPRKRVGYKGNVKGSLNLKRVPETKRVGSGFIGGNLGGNIGESYKTPEGILFDGDVAEGKAHYDYGFGQKGSILKGYELKESVINTVGGKGVVGVNLGEDGIFTTTRRRKGDLINGDTIGVNEIIGGSTNVINLKSKEEEPGQGTTEGSRQNVVIPKHRVLLRSDTGPKIANVITAGKGTPAQATTFADGNPGESKGVDGMFGDRAFKNTVSEKQGVIVVNTDRNGSVRDNLSINQATESNTKSIVGRDRDDSDVQEDKNIGAISTGENGPDGEKLVKSGIIGGDGNPGISSGGNVLDGSAVGGLGHTESDLGLSGFKEGIQEGKWSVGDDGSLKGQGQDTFDGSGIAEGGLRRKWFVGGGVDGKGSARGSVGGNINNAGFDGEQSLIGGSGNGEASTGGSFGVNGMDESNQDGKLFVRGGTDGKGVSEASFIGNENTADSQGGTWLVGGGANGQGGRRGFRGNGISARGKWFVGGTVGETASAGMLAGGNGVDLGSTGGKWVVGGDADEKRSTGGSSGDGFKAKVSQGGKWFIGGDSQRAGISVGSEGGQWFTEGSLGKKGTKESAGSVTVGRNYNLRNLGANGLSGRPRGF
ncbi:hypothetical protein NDU88_004979 [Pleurodeles waltl]|uniref:Uncharacterized protein n=1 Tax=Pleurodeles waltl TaxID=8319 RepID=A0AAV7PH76_PLEWA|nr:hypothetical protein NDU88_004979 [Pleurodeles waltl]